MGKNVRAKRNAKSVDDTCRLCLGKSADVPIWDEAHKYWYQIKMFCRVRLNKRDGLPKRICGECSATLTAIERLRGKAQDSDKFLRCRLSSNDKNTNSLSDGKKRFNLKGVKVKNESDVEDESSFESTVHVECVLENTIDRDEFSFPRSPSDVSNSSKISKIEQNTNSTVKCKQEPEDSIKEKQLCPICGKVLYNSNLNKHLESHRLKDENVSKKFGCLKCTCSFYSEQRLEKHMKYHALEKTYPCNVCGRKFKEQHIANRHLKMVHEKYQATECPVCHKVLGSKFSYVKHLDMHAGKKLYECDTCNKKFSARCSLIDHIRIHTGERPYKCHICYKRYRIFKILSDHIKLHTGEKPHKCPVCDKGFAQKGNMKSHFKYNHKDKVLENI